MRKKKSNRPAITGIQVRGQSHPIDRVETNAPEFAGNDRILSGGGDDLVFGGSAQDHIETFTNPIYGDTDNDVTDGDNGRVTLMLNEIREIKTTVPTFTLPEDTRDSDVILTGNGEDLILGGNGDDIIDSGVRGEYDNGDIKVLSVNFAGNVEEGQVTGVAGAVAADNWNNLDGLPVPDNDDDRNKYEPPQTASDLIFRDGLTAENVTIEWGENLDSDSRRSVRRDSHTELYPDTQNERLFEGSLLSNTDQTIGVDLEGLSDHYTSYDLYVYLDRVIDSFVEVHLEKIELALQAGETVHREVSITILPKLSRAIEIDVVASVSDVDLVNLTGTIVNGGGGDTSVFDVMFTGNGLPHAFDLQFVDAEFGGVAEPTIPVLINSPASGGAHRVVVRPGGAVEGVDFGNQTIESGSDGDANSAAVTSTITVATMNDADDIDRLFDNFGSTDPAYDLDGSGTVDQADVNELVLNIMGKRFGDANLDGFVDIVDVTTLIANFDPLGQNAQRSWAGADFNGDNEVDIHDFHFIFVNYAPDGYGPAVPETLENEPTATNVATAENRASRNGKSVQEISDGTTSFYLNDPSGNTFKGRFVEVTSTDSKLPQIGNYVVFRDLTSDAVSLRISGHQSLKMGPILPAIAGLQIVGGPDKDGVVVNGDFDRDTVLGDSGVARRFASQIYEAFSTDLANGEDDIRGEDGDDLIFGDNARVILFEGEVVGLRPAATEPEEDDDPEKDGEADADDSIGFNPFKVLGIELLDENIGGNDTLEGGRGDDLTYGQFGNDEYVFQGGGLGRDRLAEAKNPNDLHDHLNFSEFVAPVEISLGRYSSQPANMDFFETDLNLRVTLFTHNAFEHVTGSQYSDTILGNGRENTLLGLDGDDTLEGRGGDDNVLGGRGNDVLRGDGLEAEDDDDNDEDGVDDNDVLSGGDGNDILYAHYGGTGYDLIIGGLGADNIKVRVGQNDDDGKHRGDILISGTIVNEDKSHVLRAFLDDEWVTRLKDGDKYNDVVDDLAADFLELGVDVFGDGEKDTVQGSKRSQDLFFAELGQEGNVADKLKGNANDRVINLDKFPNP